MGQTIAAIATAYAKAGVGIIRVSGDDALNIASQIWGSDVKNYKSHTMHHGNVVNDSKIVDDAMFVYMKGPNSYTGEDTVEIQAHGGPLVLKEILDLLISKGARMAQPGEFTKRAFLNGKMDLTQAEAVMDLIDSSSNYAKNSAVKHLSGKLGAKIKEFEDKILYHMAYIENGLDDPEHIDVTGYGQTVLKEIKPVVLELDKLLNTWDNAQIIKEGISVSILGKPNAGKSSLINAILDEDKAIVTDIPGTTRDTIEGEINYNGILLKLIDTAGLRESDDEIEKIGIQKAIDVAVESNLILYVIDSNDFDIKEVVKFLETYKQQPMIIVINKIDINDKTAEIENNINKYGHSNMKLIKLSAKNKKGIDNLLQTIEKMFINSDISINDELLITNLRHKEALTRTRQSLENIIKSIENNVSEDFLTIDLMDAYNNLGLITGNNISEELVEEIFSKFCVGK